MSRMSSAELHEALLLRQAVEAMGGTLGIETHPTVVHVAGSDAEQIGASGPDLRQALIAFLEESCVEPVEWPSAEEANTRFEQFYFERAGSGEASFRDLARRDPMTALALLFGEDAR